MEDIICQEPWFCGEQDCPVGWHLASYWVYDDGTYSVDWYSDGDHEDIDGSDLPTFDDQDLEWTGYYEHVAATGEDPLDQLMFPRTTEVRERWELRFAKSIAGAVLQEARRAGKNYLPREISPELKRWLRLEGDRFVAKDIPMDDFESETGLRMGVWQTVTIKYKKARPASACKKDAKRLARRALRRLR